MARNRYLGQAVASAALSFEVSDAPCAFRRLCLPPRSLGRSWTRSREGWALSPPPPGPRQVPQRLRQPLQVRQLQRQQQRRHQFRSSLRRLKQPLRGGHHMPPTPTLTAPLLPAASAAVGSGATARALGLQWAKGSTRALPVGAPPPVGSTA